MSNDENACDLYQIMTGILMEPDNQKEMDAVLVSGTVCDGSARRDH